MPLLDLGTVSIADLSPGSGQVEYYDTRFSSGGSFGVRVSSGGRRSFFLIVRVAGRRKRVTLGHFPTMSLERARLAADEYLFQASAGRDPVAVFKSLGRPVFFKDLVERYQAAELPNVGAESTRKEYLRIINRELLPIFADFRLSAIGSSDLRRLIDSVAAERGKPVMAKRTAATMRRILNYGMENGFTDDNPFHRLVEREEEDEDQLPRKVERFLPPHEIRLIWEATREERPLISSVFRLILLTGQRPGDLLNLRWEDIHGDEWRLSRRSGVAGEQPTVFLSAPVQVVLRQVPGFGNATGPIFVGRGGLPIRHIRKAAERIRLRAGLKEHISPIDLRRTVEYGMRSIGIRPDIVDMALGRKVLSTRNSAVYIGYDYTADVRQAFRSLVAVSLEASQRETNSQRTNAGRAQPTTDSKAGTGQGYTTF